MKRSLLSANAALRILNSTTNTFNRPSLSGKQTAISSTMHSSTANANNCGIIEVTEEMLQPIFDISVYDLGTGIRSAETKKYVST